MQPDQANNEGPRPSWEVTDVIDATMLQGASFVRAKRVNYRTLDGQQSYVEVPLASFNRETVQRLINEHVAQLYDVMGAQGPLVGP